MKVIRIINKRKGLTCWLSSLPHVSPLSTLFSSFLTVLLSVCLLFLSGGASVILSLGLSSWCDTVTNQNMQPFRYIKNIIPVLVEPSVYSWGFFPPIVMAGWLFSTRYREMGKEVCLVITFLSLSYWFVLSCAESQSMPLYLDVDTSSFYTELNLAQVGLLRMK